MTQEDSCTKAAFLLTESVGSYPVCEIDRQMLRIARELREIATAIANGDWSLCSRITDSGNIHDRSLSDPRD